LRLLWPATAEIPSGSMKAAYDKKADLLLLATTTSSSCC
jgi:hypothetical protein